MSAFIAVIPARLASTRLPRKPLADLRGLPMVVRVAERARTAGAQRVLVATDTLEIVEACARHDVEAMLTSAHHATGTDRLAEVVDRLGLDDDAIVVNVQGDEPLIPPALVRACADRLASSDACAIATVAHPIASADEFSNPNVVKVVVDAHDRALYFSRAPIPFPRDHATAIDAALHAGLPVLRHVGLYAYRARFLRAFPTLAMPRIERHEALEQLRALFHGYTIAVLRVQSAPPGGVDTPEDLDRVRALLDASPASGEVL